jgi:hypothetical protein
MRSPCCLCVCILHYQILNALTYFMNLGMYIMVPGPVSTVYYINSSQQFSACTYISPTVARQRLGKHFPATTNTHPTTEEFLNVSFSMRSVSYQRRVCGSVFVSPYRC